MEGFVRPNYDICASDMCFRAPPPPPSTNDVFPSRDAVIHALTRWSLHHGHSIKQKPGQCNKAELCYQCVTAGCAFVWRARSPPSGKTARGIVVPLGSWVVTSACLEHSCAGNVKRQRGEMAKVLVETVPVFSAYMPTGAAKHQDAKQVRLMGVNVGVHIKPAVARKISRIRGGIGDLRNFFQEFDFLEGFVKSLSTIPMANLIWKRNGMAIRYDSGRSIGVLVGRKMLGLICAACFLWMGRRS